MQYAEGRPGRIFVLRVDHGEDLLATVRQFLADKDVKSGSLFFLGALSEAHLVSGPVEPVLPPVPRKYLLEGGWELAGMGTIYPGEGGPALHLHAALGRGESSRTCCLREFVKVYLVMEVVIFEFTGFSAERKLDPVTGVHLPVFS
ncbi:MAG: DUF296 domain-containing protein [Methanoregulaceae archaeon]